MDQVIYKENTKGYRVLTPDGYKSFAGIRCLGDRAVFRIEFTDNHWLECTSNHKLFVGPDQRVPVNELTVGDVVMGANSDLTIIGITDTGRCEPVYDLVEVEGGHRYYTNGVLSSNCEFVINDETLISPITLLGLESMEPIRKTGQVRWYKTINPESIYVVSLDPSLGTGGDPAAIQVFDATTTEQVAEWKHNRTDVPTQIRILADIVRELSLATGNRNKIYYSIENNTLGEAALISLNEYGEDRIPGYFLSDNSVINTGGRRIRKGFNTTHKTKLTACNKFKILVESGRMKLYSRSLISELKNFVSSGASYAAKPGETDDLVMSTLLAIRMMMQLQSYHLELDSHIRDHSDSIVEPLPFISILR